MSAPAKIQPINPAPVRKISLADVKRGKQFRPFSALVYGTEGVGKSSWAASAPNPIFIETEDGTSELDVARLPLCKTWQAIFDCVDLLLEGGHEFKTVVIDTVDAAEKLAWDHIIATKKTERGERAESIEDYGYGKGYAIAMDMWRSLLSKLEKLRSTGMNIVLLAHSHVKPFTNPEGANFDRYELKMNQKLAGLLKEWPDAVLFATYEIYASALKGEKKSKGVGTGARIVRTERRPAFDAKNRYGLPFEIPLNFEEFHAYANGRQPPSHAVALREQLATMATGTVFEERVLRGIEETPENESRLKEILNWLTAKLNEGTN